ncbi:hypothetical protein IID19_05550 [Patescibacteria group bacterium]|nr:hypothetical protein [Patescibacteria group bacterium]
MKKIIQAFCDNVDLKLLANKSRVRALNLHFRKKQYKSITLLAERYGIETYVCGCKNPDVTKELTCRDIWQKYFDKKTYQYQLFDNHNTNLVEPAAKDAPVSCSRSATQAVMPEADPLRWRTKKRIDI